MKKGVLEMCVLHLLSREPQYGYEVMKTIQEAFPGVYDGSVYGVLRRLKADGCAETFQGASSSGPPRKYYRLTDAGTKRLGQAVREWEFLIQAVSSLGIGG